MTSPLEDQSNVELTIVNEGTGYSPEDAYRVLAGVPVQEATPVAPEE